MNLYLIRHGEMDSSDIKEIDLNLINQYITAKKETGLNQKGRDQISKTARFFNDIKIDAIYCSSFARAKESAQILSENLNVDCRVIDGLGEVNVGQIDPEQSPFHKIVFKFVYNLYRRLPHNAAKMFLPVMTRFMVYAYLFRWLRKKTQNSEDVTATYRRIVKSIKTVAEQHGHDANLILVSHGYFITLCAMKAVYAHKIDFLRLGNPFWVANASVTKLSLDKKANIRLKYFARRV